MSERASRTWLTSYRAAVVLPISAPPIRDGAVLVEGDRVTWVGPAASHPPSPNARVVELGNAVLSPGLVNAHAHLDLTVLRGLLDGLSFFDWIRAVVAVRERLSADEWLDSARLGAIEALECGVTTIADTAPTAASFDAMRELGLRGIAYLEVFGPDPAQADAAMIGLRSRTAELRLRETPLVGVGVSPHAPYSVSDALYTAAAAFARESGLRIATHLSESAAEWGLVTRAAGPFAEMLRARGIATAVRGASPVDLMRALGVLGEDTLLIHCVQCGESDVATIRASGAAIATCPSSNRYFGHGSAPVTSFMRDRIRLGVGTDSMASNPSPQVLREARIACGSGEGETPKAAWQLATLDGATALGLKAVTGSLDAGKQADLAAFPIAAGTADIARMSVAPRATLTVIAGVERVRQGRVLADTDAVRARVNASANRLREWRKGATPA